MTTTKKKAKAVTLRDRVESLEYDRISLMAAASSMKQRLTALEQAQRPAEKPAAEKCPWWATTIVSWNGHHRMFCGSHLPVVLSVAKTLGLVGVKHQDARDARVSCAWHAQHAPPAPAPAEEDRLRDAVVDAALAFHGHGFESGPDIPLWQACEALRAHRAKKGGVT